VLRKYFSPTNILVMTAVMLLVVLIALVTFLATQTITHTVVQHFREQEQQQVTLMARQTEFFLEARGTDLRNLATRPEIQSLVLQRDEALDLLAGVGDQTANHVVRMVRLDANGAPRYAWPPDVYADIQSGGALPWTLTRSTARELASGSAVAFRLLPGSEALHFVLFAPVTVSNWQTELLAAEIDMSAWFAAQFGLFDLGTNGQIWVFDSYGRLLYEASDTALSWDDTQSLPLPLLLTAEEAQVTEYEVADGWRQAAFAPVTSSGAEFVVVLNRPAAEARYHVRQQLAQLTVLTGGVLLIMIGLVSFGIRQMMVYVRRSEVNAQRQRIVGTLLVLSRAINSSLDLNEVLDRILSGLGGLLAHDSALILLLEDDDHLRAVARSGDRRGIRSDERFSLNELAAAADVVRTGRPVFMPDCLADDRWIPLENSPIRSWLGVPLRVQQDIVGVLNINSNSVDAFQRADIEVAQAFADQAGAAISNARLHRMRMQHYEEELANARDIQTSLMPHKEVRLPQLEVVGRSLPAEVVSGDFYQFLPRLDGKLGIVVGDVTGKGMPAALLMAVLTTAIRREFDHPSETVADLLDRLNASLTERMQSRHMNTALALGVFDPDTRRLELANAGMVQPYLRMDDGSWQLVPVGGYPLGASIQRRYQSKRITLAPGTLMVFLTDGVLEAKNAAGDLFSFERLEEVLDSLPSTVQSEVVIDRILTAVHSHLGDQAPQDDITVVVVQSLEVPDVDLDAANEGRKATRPTRPENGHRLTEAAADSSTTPKHAVIDSQDLPADRVQDIAVDGADAEDGDGDSPADA
jgi:serine phosphatase RsbU (regulator of sigma subunit)